MKAVSTLSFQKEANVRAVAVVTNGIHGIQMMIGSVRMEIGERMMPDKENVIKGLEEISDYFFDIYRNDTDSYKCEKAQEYSDVAIDTISLLKEQQKLIDDMVKRRMDNGEFD